MSCMVQQATAEGQGVNCPWCNNVNAFQVPTAVVYPGGVIPEVLSDATNDPLTARAIVPRCGYVGDEDTDHVTRCICDRGRFYNQRSLRGVSTPHPFQLLRCAGGCGTCTHAVCASHAPTASGEWYCAVCGVAANPDTRFRRRSTRLRVGDLVMVRWNTGVRYVGRVDVTGLPGRCVDVQFFADSSIAVVPYDRALRDY